MKYNTCSFCGASLDHGEKCDCAESKKHLQAISCSDRTENKSEDTKGGKLL